MYKLREDENKIIPEEKEDKPKIADDLLIKRILIC